MEGQETYLSEGCTAGLHKSSLCPSFPFKSLSLPPSCGGEFIAPAWSGLKTKHAFQEVI